jgi:hypothetical protein
VQVRFHPTGASHVMLVTIEGMAPVEETARDGREEPLSRRLWRHLLQARDWRRLDELAVAAQTDVARTGAVLDAYRCFERHPSDPLLWRLDPKQPGLRRSVVNRAAGSDAEMAAHVRSMLTEVRSMIATARLIESDLGLLNDDVQRVVGGVR